ncbi:MAG TPA: PAS domain S-box protein [Cyclobacteriaceae bacterium]|nr:PAS domain S-box protein [Cyclobacteriaceae bacterium]
MERSGEFLAAIKNLENGPMLCALDTSYRFTWFTGSYTKAVARANGHQLKTGDYLFDLPMVDRAATKNAFDRALRGESFIVIHEHINPDKEIFSFEVRYNPLRDESGVISGVTVYVLDIRQQQEAAIQKSEVEAAYNILFQNTNDAIFVMEAEGPHIGKIVSANHAAAAMHGYTHEEFLKLNITDIDSPEDATKFNHRLEKVLEGRNLAFEVTHRKKDGTMFSLDVAVGLMTINGKKHTMSINRDITERKEIIAAALEREKFIESITASSPDLIYVFDIERRTNIYSNHHIAGALGYSEEEIAAMGDGVLKTLFHPDDFAQLSTLFSRWEHVTDDNQVLESEFRLKDRNGKWHWFGARDTVFTRNKEGKVTQVIGTARDRTENKEAEIKLRQSEERFKRLQEASFGGIGVHDQGKIIDANQGLADLTGYSLAELIGMDGLLLIAPEFREHVTQKIRIGYELPYDVIGLMKDGTRFNLEVKGKNIQVNNQVLRVTEFRDITERKQIEEAIREQNVRLGDIADNLTRKNEQLEEFTQIVSHNLRAPAGNISSLLALYESGSPEERTEYLQHLKNSSKLLLATLNELNDVLKIKQSKNIDKQELEFNVVFEKVCQMLSTRIAELGADLKTDFKAPLVHYPNIYLESILLNLLSNALKYHSRERKSVIEIKTYFDGSKIMLEVADNGLGINLSKYGHQIFKMRKTFHEHPESRGLGLFLIKNQIESMGGEISVKSEVNTGTTFYVKLTP